MSFAALNIKHTIREIDSPSEPASKTNRYNTELRAEGSSGSHRQKLLFSLHLSQLSFLNSQAPRLGGLLVYHPYTQGRLKAFIQEEINTWQHTSASANEPYKSRFIYIQK